ncbi:neurofibromin [Anaeramoeba flamelloides]|uniref:Neurofibromin n=1 Tax=Anaeramoeba flamelloides TaxID=1746091 RepID=A0AAV7ZZ46_9EUKA|nr:neurofibromin [Anaeramoeba flamelloides]
MFKKGYSDNIKKIEDEFISFYNKLHPNEPLQRGGTFEQYLDGLSGKTKKKTKSTDQPIFTLRSPKGFPVLPFHKYGFLAKLGSGRWNKRHIVLMSHELRYYGSNPLESEEKPHGVIDLSQIFAVESCEGLYNRDHTFRVITQKKSIVFQANCKEEMEDWINYLSLPQMVFRLCSRPARLSDVSVYRYLLNFLDFLKTSLDALVSNWKKTLALDNSLKNKATTLINNRIEDCLEFVKQIPNWKNLFVVKSLIAKKKNLLKYKKLALTTGTISQNIQEGWLAYKKWDIVPIYDDSSETQWIGLKGEKIGLVNPKNCLVLQAKGKVKVKKAKKGKKGKKGKNKIIPLKKLTEKNLFTDYYKNKDPKNRDLGKYYENLPFCTSGYLNRYFDNRSFRKDLKKNYFGIYNFRLFIWNSKDQSDPNLLLPIQNILSITKAEAKVNKEFSFEIQSRDHSIVCNCNEKEDFDKWVNLLKILRTVVLYSSPVARDMIATQRKDVKRAMGYFDLCIKNETEQYLKFKGLFQKNLSWDFKDIEISGKKKSNYSHCEKHYLEIRSFLLKYKLEEYKYVQKIICSILARLNFPTLKAKQVILTTNEIEIKENNLGFKITKNKFYQIKENHDDNEKLQILFIDKKLEKKKKAEKGTGIGKGKLKGKVKGKGDDEEEEKENIILNIQKKDLNFIDLAFQFGVFLKSSMHSMDNDRYKYLSSTDLLLTDLTTLSSVYGSLNKTSELKRIAFRLLQEIEIAEKHNLEYPIQKAGFLFMEEKSKTKTVKRWCVAKSWYFGYYESTMAIQPIGAYDLRQISTIEKIISTTNLDEIFYFELKFKGGINLVLGANDQKSFLDWIEVLYKIKIFHNLTKPARIGENKEEKNKKYLSTLSYLKKQIHEQIQLKEKLEEFLNCAMDDRISSKRDPKKEINEAKRLVNTLEHYYSRFLSEFARYNIDDPKDNRKRVIIVKEIAEEDKKNKKLIKFKLNQFFIYLEHVDHDLIKVQNVENKQQGLIKREYFEIIIPSISLIKKKKKIKNVINNNLENEFIHDIDTNIEMERKKNQNLLKSIIQDMILNFKNKQLQNISQNENNEFNNINIIENNNNEDDDGDNNNENKMKKEQNENKEFQTKLPIFLQSKIQKKEQGKSVKWMKRSLVIIDWHIIIYKKNKFQTLKDLHDLISCEIIKTNELKNTFLLLFPQEDWMIKVETEKECQVWHHILESVLTLNLLTKPIDEINYIKLQPKFIQMINWVTREIGQMDNRNGELAKILSTTNETNNKDYLTDLSTINERIFLNKKWINHLKNWKGWLLSRLCRLEINHSNDNQNKKKKNSKKSTKNRKDHKITNENNANANNVNVDSSDDQNKKLIDNRARGFALKRYKKQKSNELTIRENEFLLILEENEDTFKLKNYKNQKGLVLKELVEKVIPEEIIKKKETSVFDKNNKRNDKSNLSGNNNYSFTENEIEEIEKDMEQNLTKLRNNERIELANRIIDYWKFNNKHLLNFPMYCNGYLRLSSFSLKGSTTKRFCELKSWLLFIYLNENKENLKQIYDLRDLMSVEKIEKKNKNVKEKDFSFLIKTRTFEKKFTVTTEIQYEKWVVSLNMIKDFSFLLTPWGEDKKYLEIRNNRVIKLFNWVGLEANAVIQERLGNESLFQYYNDINDNSVISNLERVNEALSKRIILLKTWQKRITCALFNSKFNLKKIDLDENFNNYSSIGYCNKSYFKVNNEENNSIIYINDNENDNDNKDEGKIVNHKKYDWYLILDSLTNIKDSEFLNVQNLLRPEIKGKIEKRNLIIIKRDLEKLKLNYNFSNYLRKSLKVYIVDPGNGNRLKNPPIHKEGMVNYFTIGKLSSKWVKRFLKLDGYNLEIYKGVHDKQPIETISLYCLFLVNVLDESKIPMANTLASNYLSNCFEIIIQEKSYKFSFSENKIKDIWYMNMGFLHNFYDFQTLPLQKDYNIKTEKYKLESLNEWFQNQKQYSLNERNGFYQMIECYSNENQRKYISNEKLSKIQLQLENNSIFFSKLQNWQKKILSNLLRIKIQLNELNLNIKLDDDDDNNGGGDDVGLNKNKSVEQGKGASVKNNHVAYILSHFKKDNIEIEFGNWLQIKEINNDRQYGLLIFNEQIIKIPQKYFVIIKPSKSQQFINSDQDNIKNETNISSNTGNDNNNNNNNNNNNELNENANDELKSTNLQRKDSSKFGFNKDDYDEEMQLDLRFSNGKLILQEMLFQYPHFDLAKTLLEINDLNSALLPRLLTTIFQVRNYNIELIDLAIKSEVKITVAYNTLFRGNTIAAKLISNYSKLIGKKFVVKIYRPIITQIINHNSSFEIIKERANENENIEENQQKIIKYVNLLLNTLLENAHRVPLVLRELAFRIYEHSAIRFPEAKYITIAGFFFLRFICPSVTVPEQFGIIDDVPSTTSRRALVLISKIIQNIANGTPFTESFLAPFNTILHQFIPKIKKFMNFLIQPFFISLTKKRETVLVIGEKDNKFVCCHGKSLKLPIFYLSIEQLNLNIRLSYFPKEQLIIQDEEYHTAINQLYNLLSPQKIQIQILNEFRNDYDFRKKFNYIFDQNI